MDQKPFLICRADSRKLLWLMGISFAMVLLFQYFELPYGSLLSSLISSYEVSRKGENASDPPSISLMPSKLALQDQEEMVNHAADRFEENGSNLYNGSVLRIAGASNGSFVVKMNVDVSVDDRNGTNNIISQDEAVFPGCDENLFPNSTDNCCYQSVADEENVPTRSRCIEKGNSLGLSGNTKTIIVNYSLSPAPAISPMGSSLNISSPAVTDHYMRGPASPISSNSSSLQNDSTAAAVPNPRQIQTNRSHPSPEIIREEGHEKPIPAQITVAEMKNMLLQSHSTYHSMKPRWSSGVDKKLLGAKLQIINAPFVRDDPDLYPPLFQNFSMFKRYLIVYVPTKFEYSEGNNDIHEVLIQLGGVEFILSLLGQYSCWLCGMFFESQIITEIRPLFGLALFSGALLVCEVDSGVFMSYELMEETLKVYVYKEGQKPIIHQAVLNGIYASEGWFMKQMETNRRFVTKNARKAHLFYMPFSSRMLEETLYVANSHDHKNLIHFLEDYVRLLTKKHPFWNRTGGSDHFLVACHDWAPAETKYVMARCIRALCNADVKEGFVFGKDISLPETYVRTPKRPLRDVGGKPPSQRSILAFFAGNMHGYVRPILLKHWENKDPDMKIFGYLPKVEGKMDYVQYMKSSKYCICARGYEVNSPRVVEAIFYDCVPVIISDNFVPPFFETLNWESFAVFVLEKDIPRLKDILLAIPQEQYLRLQLHVKKVQQHFLWHSRPVRYDIFHMILHSIWFNRVLHINPR